jgi:hypothetical protein
MNGNQNNQSNLVDTTDCLEAVGVCRCWKNFLAIVVICGLLLLQISFWLVDTGYVKAETVVTVPPATVSALSKPVIAPPLLSSKEDAGAKKPDAPLDVNEAKQSHPALGEDTIKKAAEKVVAGDPNNSKELVSAKAKAEAEKVEKPQQERFFDIQMKHLNWVIRFCNFIIILAAVLYCLTLLFSFKVSLIGRLGGINHICRAFFLSLIMVIFLLPWQNLFGNIVIGAIYTPAELVKWCTAQNSGIFAAAMHYLRFTGYWLLILLLLIFSLIRSSRWTKAILRRLEVL